MEDDEIFTWIIRGSGTLLASILLWLFFFEKGKHGKVPPVVPYTIPFVGNLVSFGRNPVEFLKSQYRIYGEVFTFVMFGRKMTYLIGREGHEAFFNAKGAEISIRDAYASLTVPVFGKGVAYDVSESEFLQQKKLLKTGLTTEHFRLYVPMIQEETEAYFKRWGSSGRANLMEAMEELIILTASRCLMGKEVRASLDEKVSRWMQDLDRGFTPLNFLFPYLPLPSYRRRDLAHKNFNKLFLDIMHRRRHSENLNTVDMLGTLMNAVYKDNTKLTDDQIANLMIGLLMAGQHTSATTSSWLGLLLAHNKKFWDACFDEQIRIIGEDLPPLDFDSIRKFKTLENCIKETLRLYPPLIILMRKVLKDQAFKEYTIPAGHYVCASPAVAHRLSEAFDNPEEFNPDRFLDSEDQELDSGKEYRFSYFPFGAGRNRCIGEQFGMLQIKTIWSTLLRTFIFSPEGPIPESDYASLVVNPVSAYIRYERRSHLNRQS